MKLKVNGVYERKVGQGKKGEWSFQSFTGKDESGNDVKGSFCFLPDASEVKGKTINVTESEWKDEGQYGNKLQIMDYLTADEAARVPEGKKTQAGLFDDSDFAERYLALVNWAYAKAPAPVKQDGQALNSFCATISIQTNGKFVVPGSTGKSTTVALVSNDESTPPPHTDADVKEFADEDIPF